MACIPACKACLTKLISVTVSAAAFDELNHHRPQIVTQRPRQYPERRRRFTLADAGMQQEYAALDLSGADLAGDHACLCCIRARWRLFIVFMLNSSVILDGERRLIHCRNHCSCFKSSTYVCRFGSLNSLPSFSQRRVPSQTRMAKDSNAIARCS